jgi:hypothetical protein
MTVDLKAWLDPELVGPLAGITDATGGGFSLRDIPATRAMVDAMLAAVKAEMPPLAGVTAEDRLAPSEAADVRVPVRIYRPLQLAGPLPALNWMHPGGYVIGSIELDDLMARQLALEVGCAVISVEYRLAPEHPYPAPLDDCYGVLRWAAAEAESLAIDASRIAVGGGSAGGGLAAGLALRARDRGELNPCFQLLIYPAINDLNVAQVSESVPPNSSGRENCWNLVSSPKRSGSIRSSSAITSSLGGTPMATRRIRSPGWQLSASAPSGLAWAPAWSPPPSVITLRSSPRQWARLLVSHPAASSWALAPVSR